MPDTDEAKQYDPLEFTGVRLDSHERFESIDGLGRVLLGEPVAHSFGRDLPSPVEAGLRWGLPMKSSSVEASALHLEFARAESSEQGFLDFARRFGRLGVGEKLDIPVSVSEGLVAESIEPYEVWVDCQRLIRLGVSLSWYDPAWQSSAAVAQVDTGSRGLLTRDQKQTLAREWLKLDEEGIWRTRQKSHGKKTLWSSESISCARYRFSGAQTTWEFEGRGGPWDDSDEYRMAMLTALANDVIAHHVELVAVPDRLGFAFRAKNLWALMWLQCLTQARAHIDYRWCLHCGTAFAAPYKRSDRLFCSPKCTQANHAWREEEAKRLASEEGLCASDIVERIYDASQVDSPKRRANAHARVAEWLSLADR